MKAKTILYMVAATLLSACTNFKADEAIIRFKVADYEGFNPTVKCISETYKVEVDSITGEGTLTLPIARPAYVQVMTQKYVNRLLYIEPNKEVTLVCSGKKEVKDFSFEGELAEENRIANAVDFYPRNKMIDPKASLTDNLQLLDKTHQKALELLEKANVTPEFRQIEAERHNLRKLSWLLTRSIYGYSNNEEALQTLKTLFPMNADLLVIPDYCRMLQQILIYQGRKEFPNEENREKRNVAYVLQHMTDPQIKAYLLDLNIMPIVSLGIAGNEDYVKTYRENITNPAALARLDAIVAKFDNIAPGKPCPDFAFPDRDGKIYTLADLKGKYVYMDFWATWCGPCKAEVPSLLELEKQFAGKDIHFVGISVDRNRDTEKWKETMDQLHMEGIQLIINEKWDWLKNFMPASLSVPRFVLLDKEGCIINANMTRPSDKETAKMLEKLLK